MTTQDLSTLNQQPIPQEKLGKLLLEVHDKLETKTPGLQNAMYELHKHLLAHGELTHVMDDEDIAMLVRAHEEFKNVRIVEISTKAAKKAPTKLGTKTIDDLADGEF